MLNGLFGVLLHIMNIETSHALESSAER